MTLLPIDQSPGAVLFDLDDTLCDYASARNERLRIAFQRFALRGIRDQQQFDMDRMIADSIKQHPHGADHFVELFARFGIDDPDGARAASDWYRSHRFHGLKLFPEVQEVVQLVRDGLSRKSSKAVRPIGIITNGPAEVQRSKLQLLGIENLVDFALVSEEFGVAKPDPRIFHEALRLAGVEASEAIFIGDSGEFDIAGARAAGIASIWINRSGLPWKGLGPPPSQIRSLHDLPALLGL